MVSLARMATLILIGRYGSLQELGVYTLGLTVLMLVVGLQEAMVTTPYAVFLARYPRDQQRSFSGHLFLFSKLLTALTMLVLATAIAIGYWWQLDSQLLSVLTALCVILPFALLKEFARRWQIVHMKLLEATLIDSMNTVLLLGCLAVMCVLGRLTAFNAFLAIGLAALLSSITWVVRSHREFLFHWGQMKHTMRSCLHHGKWVAGENLLSVMQYFFANWFLFIVLGKQQVGHYAACVTIIMLANPFLLAVTTLLTRRTSRAFAEGGTAAVSRLVLRYLGYVSLAMVGFALAMFVFGQPLREMVFPTTMTTQSRTMSLLGAAMIGLGISQVVSCGLRAVNRHQVNFQASLLGLLTTAGASLATVTMASPQMSAAAFLAGVLLMAGYRCWRFFGYQTPAQAPIRI